MFMSNANAFYYMCICTDLPLTSRKKCGPLAAQINLINSHDFFELYNYTES